jgi:hypothetical protein
VRHVVPRHQLEELQARRRVGQGSWTCLCCHEGLIPLEAACGDGHVFVRRLGLDHIRPLSVDRRSQD